MDIDQTLLGSEVADILYKKDSVVDNNEYSIVINTTEHDIEIEYLNTIDIMEDYCNNHAAVINVEFMMYMGDLMKLVYPYRNNLEITIIKQVFKNVTTETYKLVLTNINENFASGRYKNVDFDTLNKEETFLVKGQCLNLAVEAVRLKKVDGIYRDVTVDKVLKGLMYDMFTKVKSKGQDLKPYITMYKADNENEYKHVIIPVGTRITELPYYLQETDYGIYNGHIGFYISKYRKHTYLNRCDIGEGSLPCDEVLTVHIYPLYNTDIHKAEKNKLIVYSIPDRKYEHIENTYLVDGDNLRILSSDNSKKINVGDSSFMSGSVGYVTLDPNLVMHRPVEILEPEVISTKNDINIEHYLKDREDTSMFRETLEIDDNFYNSRSEYLKHNGDLIQIQWKYSNVKYLVPGMAVSYVFLGDNNNVVRLNGVLHSHYTLYNVPAKTSNTILNIFIEKDPDEVS